MAITIYQATIWPYPYSSCPSYRTVCRWRHCKISRHADENLTEHVTMVEIDDDVAAVWQTLLAGEDWTWITQQIGNFDLTYENVEAFLAKQNLTLRERAFKTILRNRVNGSGGILAPGAGLSRMAKVAKVSSHAGIQQPSRRGLSISYKYGIASLLCIVMVWTFSGNFQTVTTHVFIDPTTAAGKKAGSRLYRHFELNHEEVSDREQTKRRFSHDL